MSLAAEAKLGAKFINAAEADLGAKFINAREAAPCRKTLQEMRHNQPRTPMQIDNSTAVGVANKNIQPRRTNAMDTRFHWLRDREAQKQFKFYGRPGKLNLADYWTKYPAPRTTRKCDQHL